MRSWLFKRRFAELRRQQQEQVQQIIQLQALWRGVAVRKQLKREQQAATTIQVCAAARTVDALWQSYLQYICQCSGQPVCRLSPSVLSESLQ